jgi:hypothetical protein
MALERHFFGCFLQYRVLASCLATFITAARNKKGKNQACAGAAERNIEATAPRITSLDIIFCENILVLPCDGDSYRLTTRNPVGKPY